MPAPSHGDGISCINIADKQGSSAPRRADDIASRRIEPANAGAIGGDAGVPGVDDAARQHAACRLMVDAFMPRRF